MKKRTTLEDANLWLKNNNFDLRYSILEWNENPKQYSLFLDAKRKVEFKYSFVQFKNKLKNDPSYLFAPTKMEIVEKVEQTNMRKYGTKSPLQTSETKEKIANTNLKKYGHKNVSSADSIKKKKRKTSFEKFGVSNPLLSPAIKAKAQATFRKNHPKKTKKKNTKQETVAKREQTHMSKYGVKSSMQVPDFAKKNIQSKIDSGFLKLYDGKLIKDIAHESGVAQTIVGRKIATNGYDSNLDFLKVRKTSIERLIESILKENKIEHEMFTNVGNFKPDFLIPDKKLIIECDGLYWHSDAHKKDDYHQVKKDTYKKEGFDSLFFRENEINDKIKIIESVIKNKLKLISSRVFARKCAVMKLSRKESAQFFDDNHLMGRGSGFGYALIYKGDIVCALQVKWKNRNDREMEVSRFCSKIDYSVVGGFSKLLDHAIWLNKPKSLFTFIDGRYGSGEYLSQFGFEKQKTYRSFSWTDGFETFHRMNFPGNSGYEKGFHKIWDCGQTKWIKKV